MCYRNGVIADRHLHCGNRDFRPLCARDLDLDPMTFIYELDPYSLETYRTCKNELSTSRLIVRKLLYYTHTYIHTYRQTDRQTDRRPRNYTPRRFPGGQVREPLEDDLRCSLAEDAERVVVQLDDSAHRLSYRVERVDFEELFFGNFDAVVVVVQAEFQHEAEQRALGLVADLLR